MDNLKLIYKNENLNNIHDENIDITIDTDKEINDSINLDSVLIDSIRN